MFMLPQYGGGTVTPSERISMTFPAAVVDETIPDPEIELNVVEDVVDEELFCSTTDGDKNCPTIETVLPTAVVLITAPTKIESIRAVEDEIRPVANCCGHPPVLPSDDTTRALATDMVLVNAESAWVD